MQRRALSLREPSLQAAQLGLEPRPDLLSGASPSGPAQAGHLTRCPVAGGLRLGRNHIPAAAEQALPRDFPRREQPVPQGPLLRRSPRLESSVRGLCGNPPLPTAPPSDASFSETPSLAQPGGPILLTAPPGAGQLAGGRPTHSHCALTSHREGTRSPHLCTRPTGLCTHLGLCTPLRLGGQAHRLLEQRWPLSRVTVPTKQVPPRAPSAASCPRPRQDEAPSPAGRSLLLAPPLGLCLSFLGCAGDPWGQALLCPQGWSTSRLCP